MSVIARTVQPHADFTPDGVRNKKQREKKREQDQNHRFGEREAGSFLAIRKPAAKSIHTRQSGTQASRQKKRWHRSALRPWRIRSICGPSLQVRSVSSQRILATKKQMGRCSRTQVYMGSAGVGDFPLLLMMAVTSRGSNNGRASVS